MTAQFADLVDFRGEKGDLTAVEGSPLFSPQDHGLTPGPWHTGCWRGYMCEYAVDDGCLVLRRLAIAVKDGPPPPLAAAPAVHPVQDDEGPGGAWAYRGLNLPVPFTGRLLIGVDFVRNSPRLNMGFLPAWYFETVWELVFDGGRLTTSHDRSTELANVRERMLAAGNQSREGDALDKWLDDTFSLSFEYSWPKEEV